VQLIVKLKFSTIQHFEAMYVDTSDWISDVKLSWPVASLMLFVCNTHIPVNFHLVLCIKDSENVSSGQELNTHSSPTTDLPQCTAAWFLYCSCFYKSCSPLFINTY